MTAYRRQAGERYAPGSPEAAWRSGIAAAERGALPQALIWLKRAFRLAPDDPRIALDLANVELQTNQPAQIASAARRFEALAERHDTAAVSLGLMAARRLGGQSGAAATALEHFLQRSCVPPDPGFAEIALRVAVAAGRPGWCGIDAEGRLRWGLAHDAGSLPDGVPDGPLPALLPMRVGGIALLGSPLDTARFHRCIGMVEAAGPALTGWLHRPAAPAAPLNLTLEDARGRRCAIPPGPLLPAAADAPLAMRYGFRCGVDFLRGLEPPFRVMAPDGAEIAGSPLDPPAEMRAARVPAAWRGPPRQLLPARAALAVVVAVYGGMAATCACLTAVLRALPAEARLIVVDDASPEPELGRWLEAFSADARVRLLRNARNQGFPAAANLGIAAAHGCDVLLLNSDTLLPAGALETLLAAVYAAPDIGSATPFSNDATILSYPHRTPPDPAPDAAATAALAALALQANGAAAIEIPTGVGFCLLMRHDCIAATGQLRGALFARGYGEEVDWCLRARHLGFRHVAAAGAYVAHAGRGSFGAEGALLNARNARLLNRLYPGYDALVAAHLAADPLAPARRRLDAARFAAASGSAVLLIAHNHGGGVARRVAEEMQMIRDRGQRALLLRPVLPRSGSARYPCPAALSEAGADYPDLRFALPEDEALLLSLLRETKVTQVVLHHTLGLHAGLRRLAARLHCKQEIVIHDYASFCPRVQLIGANGRYCGEPEPAACELCVQAAGDETQEGLSIAARLARSAREFQGARVRAPSHDAARRITRHFPKITPEVTPWEADRSARPLTPPPAGPRRIAVIGGIGPAKGFELLRECVADAGERGLPLEFLLAGSSIDDDALLRAGPVFVTGPYANAELPELLRELKPDLAFIPSIWPETWCYALSEAWEAGLYALAFDLGAQAERIKASGRGAVLPLGLPPARVNQALLTWHPNAHL